MPIAADGSLISMTYVHGAHEAVLARIVEMQFTRLAPGKVRLDVVALEGSGAELYEEIGAAYRKRLKGRVELTVRPVDGIGRAASGKRQLVR